MKHQYLKYNTKHLIIYDYANDLAHCRVLLSLALPHILAAPRELRKLNLLELRQLLREQLHLGY